MMDTMTFVVLDDMGDHCDDWHVDLSSLRKLTASEASEKIEKTCDWIRRQVQMYMEEEE